jgi:TolB-like protein/Tfp pilus assembly protein PilF
MSSIIEGYNYDIFISYRQKDNKGDMWVSEFVEALKTELESTFKKEISVYFDINPHDGLLETHDVDESLKEKLKCLIFIPIISRTYCDPDAFAWEHEFKAFVDQASKDQFGLKVKLPNGNVSSRVLPVQIHDLDNEDISMCESVLGGVLRGIEFIYKSAGVNRPLLPKEEDPQDNLNHTHYRDQINKVANAIKEIISAIKHPEHTSEEKTEKSDIDSPVKQKRSFSKIIAGSIIALLLIAAGIIIVPKLFKSDAKIEKSIAVLPFRNDSPDQENSAFVNGLMEKTLNNLQLIKDFRVIPRISVEQYRDPSKSATEIARELGVNYIVTGSAQKYGDAFSLSVQLIKADKREHYLWSKSFEQEIREVDDILKIQSEIAQAIAKELEANITTEEKQRIDKIPTRNLTALDFYQTGNEELLNYQNDIYNLAALDKAEDFYRKALHYDTTFAQAYIGLAIVYREHGNIEALSENFLDSILVLANTALSYDKDLAEAYLARGEYFRYNNYPEQAQEEYNKAIDINPSLWPAYVYKAKISKDPLEIIKNFHKALSIARGQEQTNLLVTAGQQYGNRGFLEISRKFADQKLKLDNDSGSYFHRLAQIESYGGDLEGTIEYYKRAYKYQPKNLGALFDLGQFCSFTGNYEEALVYIDKYLVLLDETLVTSYRYNGMHRVGYIYWKNNRIDSANYYFDLQMKFSTMLINSGLYGNFPYYDMAGIYAFRGEKEKAFENLMVFNRADGKTASFITLLKYDPLFDTIRDEPEFQQIMRDYEAKFKAQHDRIKKWLDDQGLNAENITANLGMKSK